LASTTKGRGRSKSKRPSVRSHLRPWARDALGIGLVVLALLAILGLWFGSAGPVRRGKRRQLVLAAVDHLEAVPAVGRPEDEAPNRLADAATLASARRLSDDLDFTMANGHRAGRFACPIVAVCGDDNFAREPLGVEEGEQAGPRVGDRDARHVLASVA
jgi:hypothetical protein